MASCGAGGWPPLLAAAAAAGKGNDAAEAKVATCERPACHCSAAARQERSLWRAQC